MKNMMNKSMALVMQKSMDKRFYYTLLVLMLVTLSHCFVVTQASASNDANKSAEQPFVLAKALHNMQERYDAMQSLTASFHQELRRRDSGVTQVNEGFLQWRKPLLVRWEVLGVNAELFIIEQQSIWNYFPDEELVYRYPIDIVENSVVIIKVVTGQSSLEKDFSVVDEGLEELADGRRVVRLHLYPHEPSQNFTEAILWLDIDSYLMERILIYDFYGNENDVTFSHIQPDALVPDEAVSFTPPDGTEIIDQRQ